MIETAKELFEPLPRVANLPAREFEKHFAIPQLPVVIEGMMDAWPAKETWNLQYFQTRYGHLPVEVTKSSDASTRRTTMAEFIRYMESTGEAHAYYLRNWVFEEDFPELKNEYEVPPHFRSWLDVLPAAIRPKYRWIFMGPKNSYSKLHIDVMKTNAWNVLFEGKKLWLFFAPDQVEKLSANQYHPLFPGYQFPHAEGLRGYYVVQGPGDTVFTPGTWLHQVYNLENTLALTENYVNHTNYQTVEDYLQELQNGELLAGMHQLKKMFLSPSHDKVSKKRC
jgi:hypothetical protein